MTSEEMLAMAKAERKKVEEKLKSKTQNSSYTREYEELAYMGLKDNEASLVRMYGEYLDIPEVHKSIYAPREVWKSKVLGDNDKICYFNLPSPYSDEGKAHIFWKMYYKVIRYKKEGTKKVYVNEQLHPSLFNRVFKNNLVFDPKNPKKYEYEKGWKPTRYILFQGLDRLNYQWHIDNKSFKLLSKKINIVGERSYIEAGITKELWDSILNDCIEGSGNYQFYDMFLIRRKKRGNNDTWDYSHSAYTAFKETTRYPELNQFVVQGKMTSEELSWKKFDIKKLTQTSSYTKFLFRMQQFIKDFDTAFGTKYFEEITNLSNAEKVEWKKNKPVETKTTEVKEEIIKTEVEVEAKVPISREITREVNTEAKSFDITDYVDKYPALVKLDALERSIIIGFKNDKFIFNTDQALLPCPACQQDQPIEIASRCIYCNSEFK